jgi:hypothetical protein
MCLAMDVVQSFEHVGVGQACRQDRDPGPQAVGGDLTFGGQTGESTPSWQAGSGAARASFRAYSNSHEDGSHAHVCSVSDHTMLGLSMARNCGTPRGLGIHEDSQEGTPGTVQAARILTE